jgi:hypothetical protein
MVNGDVTEAERSKLTAQSELADDRPVNSEKSHTCPELKNSMPVVFCGENFKETPNCLPDKSFGFEFGFGVNEIMDSAYANAQVNSIEPVPEIVDDDVSTEKSMPEAPSDVLPASPDEDLPTDSQDRQSNSKTSSEGSHSTVPVEPPTSAVRPSHTNSTSHNTKHKHSSSTTYHRNYQYMAANPPFYGKTASQQPGQMARNMQMVPQGQFIPGQNMAIPLGASPIPAYAPAGYAPTHLPTPAVPVTVAVTYTRAPDVTVTYAMTGTTLTEPNIPHNYQVPVVQQSILPVAVGFYKLPAVSEQAAPQGNPPYNSQFGSPAFGGAPASNAVRGAEGSSAESSFDLAHFFVPIPSTLSAITQRDVQKFMDDYVEKLNEMCRLGRIKFHRI